MNFANFFPDSNVTISGLFPKFPINCTLFIMFLVFYYYRKTIFAINQTKSQIAMDLHDEAGSILTRLYMLTR